MPHEEKEKKHSIRVCRGRRKGQFMTNKSHLHSQKKEVVEEIMRRREIIETAFFSKEMWCSKCKIPLSLDLATATLQRGLGNVYTVKCCQCPFEKKVQTNSVFGEKGQFVSVNAKAALGMVDSGIGETQFNSLLSALNVSPLSSDLLKRYERMVGKEVENVALQSCSKSLEEEKTLTKTVNDVVADE